MAIEDAITNDPAIERHGSEAAAKYMAWHWAALSKAVAKGDPTSCVLTESRQSRQFCVLVRLAARGHREVLVVGEQAQVSPK